MSIVINYDGFDKISYCTSADTEGSFSCMPELAKQIATLPKVKEFLELVTRKDLVGCLLCTVAIMPNGKLIHEDYCLTGKAQALLNELT